MPSGVYIRKKPIWNKGLKGYRHSGSFKKGHKDFTKGKTTGKNHHLWKRNPGYSALHHWLRKHYGNPKFCSFCGKKGKYVGKIKRTWNIQWANTKEKYIRNIKQFMGLCARCHKMYDR